MCIANFAYTVRVTKISKSMRKNTYELFYSSAIEREQFSPLKYHIHKVAKRKKKKGKEGKKDKSIRYKIFYASILLTHVKLHDDRRNANATREQGEIIEIGEVCAATPAICPATATMGNEWLLHVQQFGFPSREQPS